LRRLLARFDRGTVAQNMSDQAIRVGCLDQRFVQPRLQSARGEGCEGARKRRLAGHLAGTLPATQTAQYLIGRPRLDQQTEGWKVECRFCHEAARQRRTFGWRTAWKSWQQGRSASIRAIPRTLTSCLWCPLSGLPVVSAQRAACCVLDPGQKFSLNADPVCG